MVKTIARLLVASGVMVALPGVVCAGELEFSYNENGAVPLVYGFKKKETYDIAIRISDPTLVGCRVTGMSVDIPSQPEWIENLSAWMSKELTLEKKVNVPDIASQPAQLADYVLDVNFDEPYVITEDGVYVGYSFTVAELEDYSTMPISVVYSDAPGGLYVHTSRSRLKWTDLAPSLGVVSSMVVRLETDFGPTDAAVTVAPVSYVTKGEESPLSVEIINYGEETLRSFGYSYTAGDYAGSGEVTLTAPIPPKGKKGKADILIDAIPELGKYPLSVTVNTFNAQSNGCSFKTCKGEMEVLPFLPVNRPLVEEFTGLNCGYCPRGFVAMEQMSHDYPELFVGMAYHGGSYESGCMVTTSPSDWPVEVQGFPMGAINRSDLMDPSYFTTQWEKFRSDMPEADLTVGLQWADEAKTRLKATANVRFIYDFSDAGYRLSMALVASGLTNPSWLQSNYFSNDMPDSNPDSPYWEPFINGNSKVEGLVFNDVVAYYKNIRKGIEGSLPSDIEAGVEIPFTYSIDMADVRNEKGEDFINDGATLHVVAIILDPDGRVVNCNKSPEVTVANGAGMHVSGVEKDVVSTCYYDLQGRKVEITATGIYIKIEKMSDGTERRCKVVLK